ncbi:DUF6090 family protein [Winogradskyella sp. MIT101101]|uniref:DUF6090 family protein n=1 Tax=Winogradskyella sp. MIT101101 TaxID=3098297 RepID=UPI003999900C
MIKFFRRIRYQLMSKNKTGRYFKYAIGEIILVVIGILIALQVNNWNQNRLAIQKEKVYLENLKKELTNNIRLLQKTDSVYSIRKKNTIRGLELFKNNPSIKDFGVIDSLVRTNWTTFEVSRSTFDEMQNNGSLYSLQNKSLREQLISHYILGERYISAFSEINSNGQDIAYNKDIYPLSLLLDRLKQSPQKLQDIDTSWIHRPNSKIYTGFFRKAEYYKTTNKIRRRVIADFIESCKKLIHTINSELEN